MYGTQVWPLFWLDDCALQGFKSPKQRVPNRWTRHVLKNNTPRIACKLKRGGSCSGFLKGTTSFFWGPSWCSGWQFGGTWFLDSCGSWMGWNLVNTRLFQNGTWCNWLFHGGKLVHKTPAKTINKSNFGRVANLRAPYKSLDLLKVVGKKQNYFPTGGFSWWWIPS